MYKFWGLILFLCILGQVYGHAALVKPKPWWWAASRERPCGGANYTSVPKAVWPVGSNQSITWWVIAGDGMGVVHARLNLAGTSNFSNITQGLAVSQPKFDKLGYFSLSTIVPNVECTGPNNTCTIQFFTDSGGGWYSCTTVSIVCNGCGKGIPVSQDDCVNATTLPFCSSKNGKQVLVPDGQSAAQIDALTEDTFNLNHVNPNVFTNGNTTACMSLYKQMLCELYLTPCGNSPSTYTQQKCNQALSTCNLTTLHQNLYDCSIFPSVVSTTTSKSATVTTTTGAKGTSTTTATATTGISTTTEEAIGTTTTTAEGTAEVTTTTTAEGTTNTTSPDESTTTSSPKDGQPEHGSASNVGLCSLFGFALVSLCLLF